MFGLVPRRVFIVLDREAPQDRMLENVIAKGPPRECVSRGAWSLYAAKGDVMGVEVGEGRESVRGGGGRAAGSRRAPILRLAGQGWKVKQLSMDEHH
jgi:hypothetical protein